jgi:hypothetical protein
MQPDAQMSVAVGIAVASCLGWLVSTAVAVVKGKDWLEEIALRVIKSAEGRAAVLGITQEHSDRLDEKFEALTRAVDTLGARLEGRMEAMSNKIEGKLERLDTDARNLDRRLYSIEQGTSGK